VFSAPTYLKVLLVGSGIVLVGFGVFMVALLVTEPDHPGWAVWGILLFMLLGGAALAGAWLLSGKLLVDDEGITQMRPFGRSFRLTFVEITRIEHKVTSQRLIIAGRTGTIKVEKQLQDFPAFFELLRGRLPESAREPDPELPLDCPAGKAGLIVLGIFGLVGLGLLVAADVTRQGSLALLGGLLVLFAGGILAIVPLGYRFTKTEVHVRKLLGGKRFDATTVAAVTMERRYVPQMYQEVTVVTLRFGGGKKLQIMETQIGYPLEVLHQVLSRNYCRD
jgi:hypothetical protein